MDTTYYYIEACEVFSKNLKILPKNIKTSYNSESIDIIDNVFSKQMILYHEGEYYYKTFEVANMVNKNLEIKELNSKTKIKDWLLRILTFFKNTEQQFSIILESLNELEHIDEIALILKMSRTSLKVTELAKNIVEFILIDYNSVSSYIKNVISNYHDVINLDSGLKSNTMLGYITTLKHDEDIFLFELLFLYKIKLYLREVLDNNLFLMRHLK